MVCGRWEHDGREVEGRDGAGRVGDGMEGGRTVEDGTEGDGDEEVEGVDVLAQSSTWGDSLRFPLGSSRRNLSIS